MAVFGADLRDADRKCRICSTELSWHSVRPLATATSRTKRLPSKDDDHVFLPMTDAEQESFEIVEARKAIATATGSNLAFLEDNLRCLEAWVGRPAGDRADRNAYDHLIANTNIYPLLDEFHEIRGGFGVSLARKKYLLEYARSIYDGLIELGKEFPPPFDTTFYGGPANLREMKERIDKAAAQFAREAVAHSEAV